MLVSYFYVINIPFLSYYNNNSCVFKLFIIIWGCQKWKFLNEDRGFWNWILSNSRRIEEFWDICEKELTIEKMEAYLERKGESTRHKKQAYLRLSVFFCVFIQLVRRRCFELRVQLARCTRVKRISTVKKDL